MEVIRPRQKPTQRGPEEWFTGAVYIDPIATGPHVKLLSVHFTPTMRSGEVEAAIERIEADIRGAHPEVIMLVVKPQSREAYARVVQERRHRHRDAAG